MPLFKNIRLCLVCWLAIALASPAYGGQALLLEIDGPIGPATSDYLHRALDKARTQGTELVIIRMDTPGGLDTAMRDIIQDILAAPVPVVSYVAPAGARAASAGTFILYASHVAAMSPGTNLGAATPVQIGGAPKPPSPDAKPEEDKAPPADATSRKAINDAVAYIRSLAQLRGRNAEWGELAVREAASLSAEEALTEGVIDLMADDVPDLLRQLQGYQVEVSGVQRTLDTQGIVIETIEPDWRSRLLAVITNPNVAYILMLLGIYGLIFEFSNPGLGAPGVIGAICLLLALFAFQALPINYAGLGLLLLGIMLMVAEAFVPSFGALGIGGVIAFVIGSIILMDTEVPGYGISPALIAAFALSSLLLFTFVLGMVIKARRRPVVSGKEELIGSTAEVVVDFDAEGTVHLHGENWHARTTAPLQRGQKARVTGRDGLTLLVTPEDSKEKEES